jgi:hypothetical protein
MQRRDFSKPDPRRFIGDFDAWRYAASIATETSEAVHGQNLKPNVLMLEPTENRYRYNAAEPL